MPLLRAWFPDAARRGKDALLRRILGLNEGDPIRRTLSAPYRIEQDNMTLQELLELQKYLTNLKNAEPRNKVFQYIPRYNEMHLDAMASVVGGMIKTLQSVHGAHLPEADSHDKINGS